ncbi:MAG: EAL domain-containing protein [Woeseiaceae bacterium]
MNTTNQSYIHAEQMSLINKESSISLLGALLTAVFYTYILYGKVSSEILLSWFTLISLAYFIRWLSAKYFYRLDTATDGNSYTWEKLYITGTLATGLMWGIGSYYFFPDNNILLDAVIVLTIGGLVAAASVAYAPSKYMGLAFSLPAMLPLSIYFFVHDGEEYFYMGMLILIYVLVTFTSNRLMHKVNIKSFMLGIKNDALIDDLKKKMQKIESMTDEMSYQASHDMLTGLINRREFEARLEKAITAVKYNKRNHVLCYMDLDEFKIVNDTCGHVAGDALLQNLAKHLEGKIRSTDTIARLGGDEFGLLLPHCNINKARKIANDLRERVKEFNFIWDGKVFDVGVSIGLVEINESMVTLTEVLKAADSACYVAKELGKNRIHVYLDDDVQLTQRLGDMHSAQAVQKALLDDRFVLYGQEIRANYESEFKWHGEFLIRMLGDDDELIFPDKFIPAAERYHLMVDIDKWVVNKAFSYIQKLEKKYDEAVLCAVNLSGQSICDKGFLEYVVGKLDESNISASSVCFEITETAAVANFFEAENMLKTLKGMGCSFSLDDFGSGLSSFGYLKKLNVDYLKIDGSFVKTMLEDKKDYALVKSINQVGKELGMKTIAEFVEDKALHKALKKLNVDYVQGYGVAKPAPLDSFI